MRDNRLLQHARHGLRERTALWRICRLDVGLLAGFAVLAALVLVALVTRVQLIAVFAAASIVASVACSVLAGLVHDTVGPSTGSCGASSRLCCRLWPWSRRRCGNVASTACSG